MERTNPVNRLGPSQAHAFKHKRMHTLFVCQYETRIMLYPDQSQSLRLLDTIRRFQLLRPLRVEHLFFFFNLLSVVDTSSVTWSVPTAENSITYPELIFTFDAPRSSLRFD